MSESEIDTWIAAVRALAADRDLRHEPVGGINARDAPAALCPGGSNRLTGELADGFWGASCDAMERRSGGFLRKTVVPGAVLVKAHLPDLPEAVGAFDVESIEARPEDQLRRRSRKRVQFESIEFNKHFIATVPEDHDPIALRELFSPAFLTWATTLDRNVDFGASEQQMYFMWRLKALRRENLELALDNAGELFRRLRRELEEANIVTYPPGPWNAGLEHFPSGPRGPAEESAGEPPLGGPILGAAVLGTLAGSDPRSSRTSAPDQPSAESGPDGAQSSAESGPEGAQSSAESRSPQADPPDPQSDDPGSPQADPPGQSSG